MKSLAMPGLDINNAMKTSLIPGIPIESTRQNYDHSNIMSLQSSSNSILNSTPSPKSKPKVRTERTASPQSATSTTSNDKSMIDIFNVLGINIENRGWPYDANTLQELIRFRGEQEKTRQEMLKNQNITLALELLKLAQEMNISNDVIPCLFTSDSLVMEHNLNQLQRFNDVPNGRTTRKRTYSDTQLSHMVKQKEDILKHKSHGSSPISKKELLPSPNKEKPTLLPPIPIPNRKEQSLSQEPQSSRPIQETSGQYSPKFIPQPPVYPRYYNPQPDNTIAGGNPGSPGFRPYIYPTPVQYPPPQYYFVPSSTQPVPPYLMNLPIPLQKTPPMQALHSPESIKSQKDDAPVKKRRNTGINFMISTPTNPPARKYNNPKVK